jgi:iron(III) transport system substrate-binding protein
MLVALVCVLLLAACAPAAVSEKATSGEILVYTALEEEQIGEYLALFNAKYPNIKVNVVRDSTGLITAKLLSEKNDPKVDVVWAIAASSLLLADQASMLKPYAPVGLEKVRAGFRDASDVPSWVGIDAWFTAFCVNTTLLKANNLPMPTSWEDLINPVYKGYISMPNPDASGTGFLDVSNILQRKGEDAGWAYLDALHENIKVYTNSGSKPCRLAGSGDVVIGISFDYRAVQQRIDSPGVEVVYPSEGSGWDIEANALIKKTTISPAARTFLDWAISDEIMVKYAANYPITAIPTTVAIPAGYPADPIKQLAENDFTWAAVNHDSIVTEWLKRYSAKTEPK